MVTGQGQRNRVATAHRYSCTGIPDSNLKLHATLEPKAGGETHRAGFLHDQSSVKAETHFMNSIDAGSIKQEDGMNKTSIDFYGHRGSVDKHYNTLNTFHAGSEIGSNKRKASLGSDYCSLSKSYLMPKPEYARLPIKNIITINSKQKKRSSIEEFATSKASIPGPNKYLKQWVWTKKDHNNSRPKGKFLMEKKISMT